MRAVSTFYFFAFAAVASAQVAYSNGSYNNLSSVSPLNWDPNGIIQDFTVGPINFNRIRIEVQDSTTPVGTVSDLPTARIRLYNITGRLLSSLNFNETPIYDRTYTTGSGSFQKVLSGFTRGGSDVEYFDLVGTGQLGSGHYALMFNLPGETSSSTFWLSSTPVVAGNAARVFGPGINDSIGGPDNEGAFTIYGNPVPEPLTLTAFLIGGAGLVRFRRGAKPVPPAADV